MLWFIAVFLKRYDHSFPHFVAFPWGVRWIRYLRYFFSLIRFDAICIYYYYLSSVVFLLQHVCPTPSSLRCPSNLDSRRRAYRFGFVHDITTFCLIAHPSLLLPLSGLKHQCFFYYLSFWPAVAVTKDVCTTVAHFFISTSFLFIYICILSVVVGMSILCKNPNQYCKISLPS